MTGHALPLVSVILPARDAGATIVAAVTSLLAQHHTRWELLLVADDEADYAAILARAGISDPRIRHRRGPSPGGGPAAARNIGLREARGAFVAEIDADDTWTADRLAHLVPLAMRHGLACDNTGVWSADGRFSHGAFADPVPAELDANAILDCGVPLFPLFRRDLAPRGWPGVAFAEDVLFNLVLLDAAKVYALHPQPLYRYRVHPASLSHGTEAWRRADAAYAEILAGLENGDWELSPGTRRIALAGFAAKQVLNREFGTAFTAGAAPDFQAFLASRRAG